MKTMTKLLAFSIAILVSLPVFAQNGPRGQLMVGAAKVDVTAAPATLPSTSFGILDRQHVRAIIFTNGSETAGFVNIDGNFPGNVATIVNERAQSEFGIKPGNIL